MLGTLFGAKKPVFSFPTLNTLEISDERTIITVDVVSFLETFSIWSCNRRLDNTHVALLKTQILESGLNGIFTVATIDNRYYIVDGQHRYEALHEIYESGTQFKTKVVADIYRVRDEEEIFRLFKKANASRPLTEEDSPKLMLINVVDKLIKQYPQCIRDVNKTIYPYITKKHIAELLLPLINKYNKTLENWIDVINSVNTQYGSCPVNMRTGDGMFLERAKKSGFYLGLDTKDSWIKKIEEGLCTA